MASAAPAPAPLPPLPDVHLSAARASELLMAAAQAQARQTLLARELASERGARAAAEARSRTLAGVSDELARAVEDAARLSAALSALQVEHDAAVRRAALAEARLARAGIE